MDLTIQCERMPQQGETVEGSNFLSNPGGKGGNQAVAAAKFGASTRMIACVGQDVFGKKLLEVLQGYRVDCAEVRQSETGQTGVAVITCHRGDNRIILSPGTNHELQAADVQAALKRVASPGDIFVTQYECEQNTVLASLELARELGMYTIFNPAPAKIIPEKYYPFIDLLIVNQVEAEYQTGILPQEEESCREAIQSMRRLGAGQVVITLGSRGSMFNIGEEMYSVPALRVEAVDTTAAGDTFIGVLAACLAENKDMEESVRCATRAAAITITRYGAQQSIPYREEV